jgi:O-antigen ligase
MGQLAIFGHIQIVMFFRNSWSSRGRMYPSAALLALGLTLVVTFAFGGSARGDVIGLVVLRPAAVIALLVSIYLIKFDHISKNIFWTCWFSSIFLLTVSHLIPLPPSIWQQLPGREVVLEVDALLGSGSVWRPLSLAPELTRNALWSMIAPLACYLLMIQLSNQDMVRVLIIIIILGAVSGLMSVVQITQGPESIAYLYRITNYGAGVGLFANRNHQAVLLVCLMPIGFGLATIARRANRDFSRHAAFAIAHWGMALGATFIFILIIVTGSRAGLVLYLVAILLILLFAKGSQHPLPKSEEFKTRLAIARWSLPDLKYLLFILPAIIVAALVFSGRDDALRRIAATNSDKETRLSIIDPLYSAITTYFPIGSGIGTFDPVFRLHEGSDTLAPTYWNHAHNDWAEVVMTGGVPAIAIILAAAFWLFNSYVVVKIQNARHSDAGAFAFMGGCVVLLTSLSSIVEYPLRVPSICCLFAISIALISKAKTAS